MREFCNAFGLQLEMLLTGLGGSGLGDLGRPVQAQAGYTVEGLQQASTPSEVMQVEDTYPEALQSLPCPVLFLSVPSVDRSLSHPKTVASCAGQNVT